MLRTIVVDEEYSYAAKYYGDAANMTHKATENFKKVINRMFDINAITGLTAQRMNDFLIEMTSVLRATFKEQILLTASLCNEYLKKIDAADKSMSFNQSTKGVQYASFIAAANKSYTEGEIKVDKGEMLKCVSQLKEGPIKDIQDNIGNVGRISFDGSMGAVKDQNILVRDKTVESLQALLEIFNAFIDCIEGATTALIESDKTTARQLATGLLELGYLPRSTGATK